MKIAITLIIGVIVGFGLSVLYSGSDAERIVKERQAEVVGSVASNFMARQSDPVDSRATVKTVAGLNHIPVEIEVIDDSILRATGIANTFLIRTDEGIVLFDTGLGTQSAKHKRLLQEAAPGPVTHIVLSHSHADHIGGTNFWLDEFPDATIITHEKFLSG
jgi:glyoxylase-like metal-dependent hydrolase (beta-lactamase superfamily II)